MSYVLINEGPGPLFPLAVAQVFPTREDAEASAAIIGAGLLVATWYGGKDEEGRPIWGSQHWSPREPVAPGTLLLPLPESGTGCRSEHDGLLSEAARWIGSGLPLDALTREGDDYEAWEIEDGDLGGVVCVELSMGPGGWTIDNEDSDNEEKGRKAEAAALGYMDDRGGDYEEGDSESVYVAFDDEGDVIDAFPDERDAEEAIDTHRQESRYGYPWAWSWAYYIDEPRSEVVADLQAAGFVVAKQASTGHTFCGGGYDFKSSHHVVFAALRLASYGGTVPVRQDGEAAPVVNCIPVGPVRRIGGAS